MQHVEPDELAGVVVDPADSSPEVRSHVESCAQCRDELAALREVALAAAEGPLVSPPESLRARVLAEALTDEAAETSGAGVGGDAPTPLPSPVPLEARRDRRRAPWWAVVAAAAVALVAGLGIGTLWDRDAGTDPTGPAPSGDVVASTELTTLEGSEPRGEADVRDSEGTLTLHVDARPLGEASELREVWLINVDGTRMVSLGLLPAGDVGDYTIWPSLLDQGYRVLDISVEPDDGDPKHSGDSIARGELA